MSQGGYRWLTVASAEDPDGPQLQLALSDDPAAAAYQRALHESGRPAAIFHTDDLRADYDRMVGMGVEFTAPLSTHPWGSMAVLDDTCGNLIQLTQPAW